jgi:hypothetical protein
MATKKPYADEAKERWGHSTAFEESEKRVAAMGEDGLRNVVSEGDALLRMIAALRSYGAASPEVQTLIAQHYVNLKHFYNPSLPMYAGLADMYVADPRFVAYFDKFSPGLAEFMRDAMHVYCEEQAK